MGARWNWDAVCSGAAQHIYGNFSGGADNCYECEAPPLIEFEGDDARAQAEAWKRRCRNKSLDGIECGRDKGHASPHTGTKLVHVAVSW